MNSTPIVVAQIGCGYWGPNLLRNFNANKHCFVKYVVDPRPERRKFVEANYPRCTATEDVTGVFTDSAVQAVIVATPAATHFEMAMRAVEHGKHVFVEKPLAMSVSDADKLIAAATARKLTLMVGHTFLYNSAVRHVRKLLDEGQLGETYYLYSQRLNLGQIRTDVNAWWNLAPHDVSILLYLMQGRMPATIAAQGVDYIQRGIEDVVFATLTWPDKVAASIQVSWLDPHKIRRMTVVGSRKMVVYDDVSDDKITIYDKGIDRVPRVGEKMDFDNPNGFQLLHRSGDILLPKLTMTEPLQVEAGHFIECVQTGQEPLTGPRHARDVVAILEAGQQALKSGGAVTITP